jgi:DNA-binding CsgD family transcriptional regulator
MIGEDAGAGRHLPLLELSFPARAAVAAHERQLAALADVGLWAVTEAALPALFTATVNLLATILDVELAGFLEARPERPGLALRAGVGWAQEWLGQLIGPRDSDSLLGRILERRDPVSVQDTAHEARFRVDAVLHSDGARSGLAAVVPGRAASNGILLAFGTHLRTFDDSDLSFVQAIANVLGAAIERHAREDGVLRRDQELRAHWRDLLVELLERERRTQELVERVLIDRRESGTRLRPASAEHDGFSARERQILRLLVQGHTNRQIAAQVHLSTGSVKNYLATMLPRLGAADRTQAAVRAVELGLVSTGAD